MELLKYTLQNVSYAIVEPSYALILILMGLAFYMKNRKITLMEKLVMGKNTISAFELTISQIVMGIFGGVLVSIILTFLGVSFYESSNIFLIFILSVGLIFVNPKLGAFSYSGSVLGLVSILLFFLSQALNKPNLNVMNLDITNLIIVIAVMHFAEGLLIILDGKRGAIPVFSGRDKHIIGGFAYGRQWVLPMIILLMVQASGADLLSGNAVNTPGWWPLVNHEENLVLFATMIIGALPMYSGLSYKTATFTKSKGKKPVISGALLCVFSIFVLMLSQFGNINKFLDTFLLVLIPLAHEGISRLEKQMELKAKPKYVSTNEGVCVLDVAPNSIAKEMGLCPGDLILEINEEKVLKDEVVFKFLERMPYHIKMYVRGVNGEIKILTKNIQDRKEKLGFVIVPREVPKQVKVAGSGNNSGGEMRFSDIINNVKKKKNDED